jgi:hypothetical protein
LAEENNKNRKPRKKPAKTGSVLRCINIDCIFNSSNDFGGVRNTCCHPKVAVESRFADITIAICSEFRSKKDYSFEKPSSIFDLKTGEKQEIVSIPEIGVTPVKTVTTEELEESVTNETGSKPEPEQIIIPTVKPQIIQPEPVFHEELTFYEKYNLSDNPKGDFLILKKLYQPYTRKGFIFSVIIHLFIIFFMFLFIVPKDEEDPNNNNLQRIVVVEDLEMPKFDPPDVDKMKEDEEKKNEEVKSDETKNIRPNIQKKTVIPKINRPSLDKTDTNKVSINDSNKFKPDSNLTKLDTTKFIMPDSLRQNFSENEVGLSMDYLRDGWKIIDNKTITGEKSFTGVIMRLDSLNPDVKNVTVFIHMDDPAHSAYNKNTYKNIFTMDDSTIAYVTDPMKMSGKSTEFKYFLFTDPTGQKNVYINAQFNNEEVLKSYKPKVDAVIRTIKILPPKPKNP